MEAERYPILEYDPSPHAVIEPSRVLQPRDVPERCVLCFFQDVIGGLRDEAGIKINQQALSQLLNLGQQ